MFAIPDSSHRTCLIVGCQALALNPTNWKIKQVYLQEDVLVIRKYKFTKMELIKITVIQELVNIFVLSPPLLFLLVIV